MNKIIVVLDLNYCKLGGKSLQKKLLRTWIFHETENDFDNFSVFLFIFCYFLSSDGIKKIANICGRLKKIFAFWKKGDKNRDHLMNVS